MRQPLVSFKFNGNLVFSCIFQCTGVYFLSNDHAAQVTLAMAHYSLGFDPSQRTLAYVEETDEED
jgi:hypothetical protein